MHFNRILISTKNNLRSSPHRLAADYRPSNTPLLFSIRPLHFVRVIGVTALEKKRLLLLRMDRWLVR